MHPARELACHAFPSAPGDKETAPRHYARRLLESLLACHLCERPESTPAAFLAWLNTRLPENTRSGIRKDHPGPCPEEIQDRVSTEWKAMALHAKRLAESLPEKDPHLGWAETDFAEHAESSAYFLAEAIGILMAGVKRLADTRNRLP